MFELKCVVIKLFSPLIEVKTILCKCSVSLRTVIQYKCLFASVPTHMFIFVNLMMIFNM